MSKELKWCKQFVKCSSLSMYHRKRRVRKKNRNRVVEMFSHIDQLPYPVEWKKRRRNDYRHDNFVNCYVDCMYSNFYDWNDM